LTIEPVDVKGYEYAVVFIPELNIKAPFLIPAISKPF